MVKIWYSVMNSEHILPGAVGAKIMAGTVFRVRKVANCSQSILCTEIEGAKRSYVFTADFCKKAMSKPTVDLSSAIEYSIMQCESAYC